ncbi:MAG: hydroxymethylbilane synthase [Candidatus Baltobacteraceae bacterium]
MPHFPLNLAISGRLVTIVGGGKVALRKALALRAAGAHIRIIAPSVEDELAGMCEGDAIRRRAYQAGDLDGSMLAIAATADQGVNASVLAEARAHGILCSDAADPPNGDFTFPATLRLDEVTVAVDTAGSSPGLAKRILADVAKHLDPQYGRVATTLRAMREYARGVLTSKERSPVLSALAALPLEELAAMGPLQAQHRVDAMAQEVRGIAPGPGTNTAVCASRASRLALAQSRTVAAKLALEGIATTILSISTLGDQVQDRSVAAIGQENIWVKELELALRDGRAQYAVHSCKDLPSTLEPDMKLVAISAREDARDAFCSERFESFAELAPGSRVGTSSERRRAQLRSLRPDLTYVDIRGNVDTRMRKLRAGDYDAIVLAMAGLRRLGVSAKYTVPFDPLQMVPATGQGALAIEMLDAHPQLQQAIRNAINDPVAELEVLAERAALARLRGGCQAPIGIHALTVGRALAIRGIVVSADGRRVVRAHCTAAAGTAAQATALGVALADQLLASGADSILSESGGLAGKLILLPRTREGPSRIAQALEAEGGSVIQWRAGEAATRVLGERLPDMIVFPSSGSVEAAAALLREWTVLPHPAIAAMGPASASAATAHGFAPDVVAASAEIEPLIAAVVEYFR